VAHTGGHIQVLAYPVPRDADGHEHPTGTVGLLTHAARHLVELVVEPLRPPAAGSVARDLAGAVAGARLLVVLQSLPQLAAVVEVLTEPVVAVPDRPLPPDDADVVLALAPWTGSEVIGAAFEMAAHYGVDLRVVQAREPRGDPAGAARTCADDLAAWQLTRPEVSVQIEVVDGDPAEALRRCARPAQLLVMGRPARGRARELVTPSPASDLLRTAACPVLVVPPPGVPRPTWSSRPGWGVTH
jgi:nucleotide-binding universal stress UspA family protein